MAQLLPLHLHTSTKFPVKFVSNSCACIVTGQKDYFHFKRARQSPVKPIKCACWQLVHVDYGPISYNHYGGAHTDNAVNVLITFPTSRHGTNPKLSCARAVTCNPVIRLTAWLTQYTTGPGQLVWWSLAHTRTPIDQCSFAPLDFV